MRTWGSARPDGRRLCRLRVTGPADSRWPPSAVRSVRPVRASSSSSGTATRRLVPSAWRAALRVNSGPSPASTSTARSSAPGSSTTPSAMRSSSPVRTSDASCRGPSPSSASRAASGASNGSPLQVGAQLVHGRAHRGRQPGAGERGTRPSRSVSAGGRARRTGVPQDDLDEPRVGQVERAAGGLERQAGVERVGGVVRGDRGREASAQGARPAGVDQPAAGARRRAARRRRRRARPSRPGRRAAPRRGGPARRPRPGRARPPARPPAAAAAPRRRSGGGATSSTVTPGRDLAPSRVAQHRAVADAQRQRVPQPQPDRVAAQRAHPGRHGRRADVQGQLLGQLAEVGRRRRARRAAGRRAPRSAARRRG